MSNNTDVRNRVLCPLLRRGYCTANYGTASIERTAIDETDFSARRVHRGRLSRLKLSFKSLRTPWLLEFVSEKHAVFVFKYFDCFDLS